MLDEDVLTALFRKALDSAPDGVCGTPARVARTFARSVRRLARDPTTYLLRRAREELRLLREVGVPADTLWADDGREQTHWSVNGLAVAVDVPACGAVSPEPWRWRGRAGARAVTCAKCRRLMRAAGRK
jgi:hypothetical protein